MESKPKERCGFGCGRFWDESGDFDDCPSAYHVPSTSNKKEMPLIDFELPSTIRKKYENNAPTKQSEECEDDECDRPRGHTGFHLSEKEFLSRNKPFSEEWAKDLEKEIEETFRGYRAFVGDIEVPPPINWKLSKRQKTFIKDFLVKHLLSQKEESAKIIETAKHFLAVSELAKQYPLYKQGYENACDDIASRIKDNK